MKVLVLSETDIKGLIDMKDSLDAVEAGIRALGLGRAVQPPKIYMDIPGRDGFIKPMTAYLYDKDVAATKIFTLFKRNPAEHRLPSVLATIQLNDPETGAPTAYMDGTWITTLRTGAATGVAGKYLAKKSASVAGIIGAGVQGWAGLLALSYNFRFEKVLVRDVVPAASRAFVERVRRELGAEAEEAPDNRSLAEQADIILTATVANEPLIQAGWVKPGATVIKIGSYQEVDLNLAAEVDKLVVDSWEYTSTRVPEIRDALARRIITQEKVYAELGDIVAGKKPGRERDDERILCVMIGMGVEDAGVAGEVYARAIARGVGTWVEL